MQSSLPEWKKKIIAKMKIDMHTGKLLSFVHIPKCGGCFVGQILSDACFNIVNKGHRKAERKTEVCFAIIRDPVDRFESLLNYRLGERMPRMDFPKHLRAAHFNKSISLNDIVPQFSSSDTVNLYPYRTLSYWAEDVDLLITMDELEETLHLLLHDNFLPWDKSLDKKNVSEKNRGTIDTASVEHIRELYKEDVALFKEWTRSDE